MIYICIDHATIYCHSRYSMNRKYEYATDKICKGVQFDVQKLDTLFIRVPDICTSNCTSYLEEYGRVLDFCE